MSAFVFFCILFGLIYSVIQHANNSERKRKVEHIEEVPVQTYRPRSAAVRKTHDDEAAGFLLLTDNLRDSDD